MYQSEYESSLGMQAPSIGLGLWYDAEKLILEGIYLDEVSAYRARRSWIKTFEMNFLLEEIHDFKVRVGFDTDEHRYHVQCSFTSACGRYAFWRLTHHQAPEVQFSLETAHLPHMTTVRVAQPIIEHDLEDHHPQVVSAPVQEPEPALTVYAEVVQLLKRKTRQCARKVRSMVSQLLRR